jgi:hypothetical protein
VPECAGETLNSRIDNSHAGITEMFFQGLSLLLLPAFQREGNGNYHFCIISESGNSSGVVLLGGKLFSRSEGDEKINQFQREEIKFVRGIHA